MAGVFLRRGKDMREEGHVKTEAEIGLVLLKSKASLGPRKDPSLEPSENAWPYRHLDFGLLAS